MKLSVFTVATPDLTPEELAKAAIAAGIEGIEWRFKDIPADAVNEKPSFWRNNLCSIDPNGSDEELERFRLAAVNNNLVNLSITPYLNACNVAETEHVFKTAQKIGASFIRVGVPGYDKSKNYNDLYATAVDYLHHVQEFAQQYGIKALTEIHHNTITPSAGLAHRLVSNFNSDYIGVLHDAGNMVHEGYENFRMGLELLGPYLAHVHVKNARWLPTGEEQEGIKLWKSEWAPLNEGIVNWKQLLNDLKEVGYDGYLGIEDFSGQYGSQEMLNNFASKVKQWLA
ncbi:MULTISPECIES: sugar phosphate isomerase/epimerase [unclassified Paenibacillus]|uniref:sugar phosphate isomerase/epimerase family protein n=1 Tax=unclassified Paenibacillus TaxID=185978 RepID=UPI0027818476|nr:MULTISPECIES: sugar phosphate isomerase/epimerase family protein [unclassified Paenibacillus]MDQ0903756.1 sugar phosphate isomerase/epimerase [Paenibacillus sp. V4I7]MDQ0917770.1 sugar phosphate isomerase/epimerase [Paenibacillus sp. V4I5]